MKLTLEVEQQDIDSPINVAIKLDENQQFSSPMVLSLLDVAIKMFLDMPNDINKDNAQGQILLNLAKSMNHLLGGDNYREPKTAEARNSKIQTH